MNTTTKKLGQRQIKDMQKLTGIKAELKPETADLTKFSILVEMPGKDEQGALTSRRKGKRIFSAAAALRFARDELGKETIKVSLQPGKGKDAK